MFLESFLWMAVTVKPALLRAASILDPRLPVAPRRAILRKGVVDIVDEFLWCSGDLEVGELFDLLVQHR